MRQVQINIINPENGSLERVELFKDETINLNQTIQNARDIGSIFTDFTQSFSVPASRKNNRLFEQYYNYSLTTGFNANDKRQAQILLNTMLFRKGYIALNGVELKDNKPHTYKVTFFGETVDIKKQLKDLTLRNLYEGYNALNHDYDVDTVSDGLSGSLFSGEIIYPLISHTNRYFYDSSTHSNRSSNLYFHPSSGASHNQGVAYSDLKPAIKLKNIIQRINAVTDLNFSFATGNFWSTLNFLNQYMWLSRERGGLGQSYNGQQQFTLNIDSITNFFADGGTGGGFVPPLTTNLSTFTHTVVSVVNGQVVIDVRRVSSKVYENVETIFEISSSSTYSFYIINTLTNDIVQSQVDVTGSQSIGYTTQPPFLYGQTQETLRFEIRTSDSTATFTQSVKLIYRDRQTTFNSTLSRSNTITPSAVLSEIDIALQMPEMKVLDFLTGIFKMNNLTAYFDADEFIQVRTLDDFYDNGGEYDISEFVDVSKKSVNYPIPYQEIAFRYPEPKTFLAINFEEINGYKFGNLENATTTSDVQSTDRGSKYVVKAPFEKMIYERINNIANGDQTKIQYGYCVDKDQNPVAIAPLIFYRVFESASGACISFQDLAGANTAGQLCNYNRPSNTRFNDTLNFNSEVDEFSGTVPIENLFYDKYRRYISALFNRQRRLVKTTAYLPLKILLNYSLADTFVVNGVSFQINSIKTNLQTGKCELELFNKLNTI
jgi:hypothetical protein